MKQTVNWEFGFSKTFCFISGFGHVHISQSALLCSITYKYFTTIDINITKFILICYVYLLCFCRKPTENMSEEELTEEQERSLLGTSKLYFEWLLGLINIIGLHRGLWKWYYGSCWARWVNAIFRVYRDSHAFAQGIRSSLIPILLLEVVKLYLERSVVVYLLFRFWERRWGRRIFWLPHFWRDRGNTWGCASINLFITMLSLHQLS